MQTLVSGEQASAARLVRVRIKQKAPFESSVVAIDLYKAESF